MFNYIFRNNYNNLHITINNFKYFLKKFPGEISECISHKKIKCFAMGELIIFISFFNWITKERESFEERGFERCF